MDTALECFLLRVRARRSQKLRPLDNVDGQGTALVDLLKAAVQPFVVGNYKGHPGHSVSLSAYTVSKTGFTGTLKVGEYGTASELVDVTDGKTAFQKSKNHAEYIPFYVRVHIPAGGDRGLLIMQRLGAKGFTRAFRSELLNHFHKSTDGLMLDIMPSAPDFVIKRYLNDGAPRSVSFIKNTIPADFADGVSGTNGGQAQGKIELKIQSPSPAFFRPKAVAGAFEDIKSIKALYSFDAFEPDRVKMKVLLDGKVKTLNLTNKANLRASFDITDEVSADASGFPHQKDVATAAQDVLEQVSLALGFSR